MRPDPQYVLDLAAQLVAARKEVDMLQGEWDALFPDTAPSMRITPSPNALGLHAAVMGSRANSAMRADSGVRRTLEYLNANSGSEYSALAIATALGIPAPSIRSNLSKLFHMGKVRRRGDGLYRALEAEEKRQEETPA
jgi:hypothetical protein